MPARLLRDARLNPKLPLRSHMELSDTRWSRTPVTPGTTRISSTRWRRLSRAIVPRRVTTPLATSVWIAPACSVTCPKRLRTRSPVTASSTFSSQGPSVALAFARVPLARLSMSIACFVSVWPPCRAVRAAFCRSSARRALPRCGSQKYMTVAPNAAPVAIISAAIQRSRPTDTFVQLLSAWHCFS